MNSHNPDVNPFIIQLHKKMSKINFSLKISDEKGRKNNLNKKLQNKLAAKLWPVYKFEDIELNSARFLGISAPSALHGVL